MRRQAVLSGAKLGRLGGSYAAIYEVVRRIPEGRVATYGQVAALAGVPGHARQVGYALSALPDESDVPWHRVINARGAISLRATPGYDRLQRALLEAEGVRFGPRGRVSLAEYRWRPKGNVVGAHRIGAVTL